jgi:DNA-binding NtrC family response regulator
MVNSRIRQSRAIENFMANATVLVFEKRPRWTPELQRQFAGHNVSVRNCHSLADVNARLQEARQPVAILDFDAAPADVLQFLGKQAGFGSAPPTIVLASAHWAELEWRIRELGAVDFIVGPLPGQHMADLCRRQLKNATLRKLV